jgi:hypothetical protein
MRGKVFRTLKKSFFAAFSLRLVSAVLQWCGQIPFVPYCGGGVRTLKSGKQSLLEFDLEVFQV